MNREQKIGVLCAMFPMIIVSSAFYYSYVGNVEQTKEFKVFFVECWETDPKITQVLTWGDGKYQFIGNWTSNFELDQTYRVTFVQRPGHSKHVYNNLIIVDWEEN